jgi:hypothetical protein
MSILVRYCAIANRTLGQYAEGYAGSNRHTHLLSKAKITFQSFFMLTTGLVFNVVSFRMLIGFSN